MNSIHVYNRVGLKEGVEFHRHAEATEHHVCITILGAECLVGDFKTWGAIDRAINPGHLHRERIFKA